MDSAQNTDYKKLLTDVIKKQIVILGPAITIAKARNVKGLSVDDQGTVTEISGPPQEVIQGVINQFVELSGLIVRKTMEPLLANYPDGISTIEQGQAPQPVPPANEPPQQTQPASPQPEQTLDQTPIESGQIKNGY